MISPWLWISTQLLDMAGLSAKSSAPKLSGKSLLPLLKDAKSPWPEREYFCAETGSPQSSLVKTATIIALRKILPF